MSNKKEERRKGKIQLIDATAMKFTLRKNMGKKSCELTDTIRKEIMRIFLEMEESEISKVFRNKEFAYWNITVERPLRLRILPDRAIPETVFKKKDEMHSVTEAISSIPQGTPLDDWAVFAKATGLKASVLKKIRPYITEKDSNAKAIDEPDVDLRDTEIVPFEYDGGINGYMQSEVLPYFGDAWVDEKKTQVGYEISFTKNFYHRVVLREIDDITSDLKSVEEDIAGLLANITEGLSNV